MKLAGSSIQEVLPFTGIIRPFGVAVDSTGNVYVTDLSNQVLKLPLRSPVAATAANHTERLDSDVEKRADT